jgi:uncharacterized membrane protein YfcA
VNLLFFGIELTYPVLIAGLFILGLISGGFSNVTSGGAGILTIYLLTNFLNLTIQQSAGTVLAASTVFVFFGAISFYRKKQVDMKLAITVGLSGVVGAFFAAKWASTINPAVLKPIFGAFTLAFAIYTSYLFLDERRKKRKSNVGNTDPQSEKVSSKFSSPTGGSENSQEEEAQVITSRWRRTDATGLAVQIAKGALIGVATGLFGVGLASLSVVLFIILFKLDLKMVLGTSLFASFFRFLGGSVGYLTSGEVNLFYFAIITIAGTIGSVIGAKVVLGKGRGSREGYIKILIIGILLFISYEFLLENYFPIHIFHL